MNYEETMQWGAAQYADVLIALRQAGFPAEFTQTGGMCAALEVRLEGGATVLVTDADDSLAWDRDEHRGWAVGLYPPGSEYDTGPIAYCQSEDGRNEALLVLITAALRAR